MAKKPTIAEIREYLEEFNPLGLKGASIDLISVHNHLHYRLGKAGKIYCLRMVNPESHRAGEWLTIPEEYVVLHHLKFIGLGPIPYFVDPERFRLPLFIQEFVSGVICFNDLKPLNKEHLKATAEAIALLNSRNIDPIRFPFRKGFTRYSYLTSLKTWEERLKTIKEIISWNKESDVLEWVSKLEEIVNRAKPILEGFEPLLRETGSLFNFDGAHCGNTYWREKSGRVVFLDWQKVSYGDPSFTLARFLTSAGKDGEIPTGAKELMVESYIQTPHFRQIADDHCRKLKGHFRKLVDQRLFERQIADLIWVVWHYVEKGGSEAVEGATSVSVRYARVLKLLEQY